MIKRIGEATFWLCSIGAAGYAGLRIFHFLRRMGQPGWDELALLIVGLVLAAVVMGFGLLVRKLTRKFR